MKLVRLATLHSSHQRKGNSHSNRSWSSLEVFLLGALAQRCEGWPILTALELRCAPHSTEEANQNSMHACTAKHDLCRPGTSKASYRRTGPQSSRTEFRSVLDCFHHEPLPGPALRFFMHWSGARGSLSSDVAHIGVPPWLSGRVV